MQNSTFDFNPLGLLEYTMITMILKLFSSYFKLRVFFLFLYLYFKKLILIPENDNARFSSITLDTSSCFKCLYFCKIFSNFKSLLCYLFKFHEFVKFYVKL